MNAAMTSAETFPGAGPVALRQVAAARERIAGQVLQTPLLPATRIAAGLWLKAENLQPTGAFKIRGAMNAVAALEPATRACGVVTHSSGNHGQALAWAARAFGVPAVVVMPEGAAPVKVRATRELGAEIVVVPADRREAAAQEVRDARGATIVPPFDHPDVVAGQGTLALEVLDQLDDIETVLVPVGGGGLISGIGSVFAALSPRTRVVGVEPTLAADVRESLARGRRVAWEHSATSHTMADGTRAAVVGAFTFPIIQSTVSEIVTVDEAQILGSVALLARRTHLVVEPSGALSVAAYLADPTRFGRTVAVLSGGNVDDDVLARALAVPS